MKFPIEAPKPSRFIVKLVLVVTAFAALKIYDEYQKEQFATALRNLKESKKKPEDKPNVKDSNLADNVPSPATPVSK